MDFARLVQIRDFLKDVCMLEDRVALEKWIRLVAERLNAPVEPYVLRSAKRPRGSPELVRVVPDSLESAYVQNMPLDIDELMNSQ